MNQEILQVTPATSMMENIVEELYYNIILTFDSSTFLENSKKYLISNIKTCHTFFYGTAIIEAVTGYPPDIVVVINENEYSLQELINLPLNKGDNISLREKGPLTTNSNFLLEFFIRVPVGVGSTSS